MNVIQMMPRSFANRLAVCSWSLQPPDPHTLVERLASIGIPRVQLALDPLREAPGLWGDIASVCRAASVRIVSGMCTCAGEDYSTLDSIRATGGVVPDSTWDENWRRMEAAAAGASQVGLKLVTFHAGFIPGDPGAAEHDKIRDRLRQLADLFARQNIDLALETGQETAQTLRALLSGLNRSNVGVNFDPANMILYDRGDPIEALITLAPWIRQVHVKDARRTRVPGAWGEEVTVGTGEVNWKAFLETLESIGFAGDFCIEREAGLGREDDIRVARDHLLGLRP